MDEQSRDLAAARQKYGEIFFLFVDPGYYKGLRILLEAMQGVGYKLVIVGSGPLENELRKQAQPPLLQSVVFARFTSGREPW